MSETETQPLPRCTEGICGRQFLGTPEEAVAWGWERTETGWRCEPCAKWNRLRAGELAAEAADASS